MHSIFLTAEFSLFCIRNIRVEDVVPDGVGLIGRRDCYGSAVIGVTCCCGNPAKIGTEEKVNKEQG